MILIRDETSLFGAAFAAFIAVLAIIFALKRLKSGVAERIYGVERATHRRVALVSLVVAALLAVAACTPVPSLIVTAIVASYTLGAVLYLTSFARGSGYDDE